MHNGRLISKVGGRDGVHAPQLLYLQLGVSAVDKTEEHKSHPELLSS